MNWYAYRVEKNRVRLRHESGNRLKSVAPDTRSRVRSRRSASQLQSEQFAHVFYRRAAKGEHAVVVFFQIEGAASLCFGAIAQVELFAHADEIGRKLRRSKSGAFPFGDRLTFLLKAFLLHQIHRFFFAHFASVNALIEDRVADDAQSHFQLLHFDFRPAVTLFRSEE